MSSVRPYSIVGRQRCLKAQQNEFRGIQAGFNRPIAYREFRTQAPRFFASNWQVVMGRGEKKKKKEREEMAMP
jgi:hypothetical protein